MSVPYGGLGVQSGACACGWHRVRPVAGYPRPVRWESLFADLQGQLDAARHAEDDARIADLAELEMGRTALADRIRARQGGYVSVRLLDGSEVTGTLADAAPHWLLLRSGERRCVVPLDAVVAAWPLGPVAPEAGAVESRLGIPHVLRAIAREGATVRIRAVGADLRGRIVRVGADHLDLTPERPERAPGRGRGATVTLALRALLSVEST